MTNLDQNSAQNAEPDGAGSSPTPAPQTVASEVGEAASLMPVVTPRKKKNRKNVGDPPLRIPPKLVNALIALGFPSEKWSPDRIRAANVLGAFANYRFTARMMLVSGFTTIDSVDRALKILQGFATDTKLTPWERTVAAATIAKVVDVYRHMSEHIVDLSKECANKGELEIATAKNLPPQFNVQINVPSNPAVSAPPTTTIDSEPVKPLPPV